VGVLVSCARCGHPILRDRQGDLDGVQWQGRWYCCTECSVWAERIAERRSSGRWLTEEQVIHPER
jgi:hypothetical protein